MKSSELQRKLIARISELELLIGKYVWHVLSEEGSDMIDNVFGDVDLTKEEQEELYKLQEKVKDKFDHFC